MKTTNKIFLVVLFCFSFISLNAQVVPGYMGKRAFLEYKLNSSIVEIAPPGFVFSHNVSFNYVLKRRMQLGLTYDYLSFKEPKNSDYQFSGKVRGDAIGVIAEFYLKNSLAPVGRYLSLEFKYVTGEYVGFIEQGNNYIPALLDYDIRVLSVGLGTRRVFYDRMVFNVGGSAGLGLLSEEEYSDDGVRLVRISNLWRMHIGVGVLLF